jgi:hypothetical protein
MKSPTQPSGSSLNQMVHDCIGQDDEAVAIISSAFKFWPLQFWYNYTTNIF